MAPERFREGQRSSIASDVFSVGMVLFELLLGKLPFSSGQSAAAELLSGR